MAEQLTWSEAAAAARAHFDAMAAGEEEHEWPATTLQAIIRALAVGDSLALMDRNSLLSDWRPVFVVRKEAELWVLLDANRELLDELADGCPAAGFHTNDLVRDIGTDFYKVPDFGAQAGDDNLKAHDLGTACVTDPVLGIWAQNLS